MVAVVVPSPAMSDVFWATALTSLAPMFSNGSARSISLETVTPSLVTVGPPNDLSMMTFRPVGPRVMPTARASFSAPCRSFLRASSVYSSCFAMGLIPVLRGLTQRRRDAERKPRSVFSISASLRLCVRFGLGLLHKLGEDVALAEDLQLAAADLHVRPAVLAV